MTWLDWCIVVLPVLVVLMIGLKSQKYVKSVADFLAAGRVAGRYVICVASGEANMGLVSLVVMWEMNYAVGYGIGFWGTITAPLALILGLTGYCTYRFRETRAMTMGQGEITPKMKMILRKTGKFDVGKPIGIDANYTKGDRILAWSVFLWSFGFRFTLCFICIIIWNAFYRWPAHWWAIKMHITSVYVPCVAAIVSTVWFLIGGTLDLRRLFKALDAKIVDYSDDGRVDHSKIDE